MKRAISLLLIVTVLLCGIAHTNFSVHASSTGITLYWPVNVKSSIENDITQRYTGSGANNHQGVDISYGNINASPIYAVWNGVVVRAEYGYNDSYGNLIVIEHSDLGIYSFYAHCLDSSFTVSVGQTVNAGQRIASVGNTGNSTGPHLHLGLCSYLEYGWPRGYINSNPGVVYDFSPNGTSAPSVESSITISGQNAPTVLNVGDRFWFKGIVSSAKPLAYVFATVNDMNGNAVTSKQYFTSAYSVDIASTIDEYLIMQNLPVGKYQYYVDARDSSGYLQTLHSSEFYVVDPSKDSAAPIISNVKITEISEKGYRITCDVNDETGILKVTFPTWTEYNGQDDLTWHEAEVSGNKATLYINASDHNNETGKYNTHIYATDWLGQVSSISAASDVGIYVGEKAALTIKTQPKTTYAKLGSTAKITVEASGEGLTYQWYFKRPDRDTFEKSSITSATYSTTMKENYANRQMYCVVTDKYGNTAKTNTIYLYMAATITKQPVDTSAAVGSKLSVSVEAAGDGLTYQWYFKRPDRDTFEKSSITSATYSTTMKAEYSGRQLYCIVIDKHGKTVKSDTITITASASSVKITTQPTTTYAKLGSTTKITVAASGEGLTYQWYFKRPDHDTFEKSSITSATYSTTMKENYANRQMYCVVTDKYGNTAKTNTIYLYMAATITKQPVDTSVPVDSRLSVSVEAVGDGLTYQWYFKKPGSTTFTKSSITSATYSTTMLADYSGRQLYCIVTDKHGKTAKSDTITITSSASSVKITTQPTTTYAKLGSTAKITVAASGEGLTYQWYYKNPGSSAFTKSSITSAVYSTTMKENYANRQMYCVVTDKYGNTAKTNTIYLYMAATITKQPVDTSAAVGSKLSVSVGAAGDELTYQWYFKRPDRDTFEKSSITSATYSTTMKAEYSDRQLYCIVTDKHGKTVKSDTITISAK